jgi:hypothetical protein
MRAEGTSDEVQSLAIHEIGTVVAGGLALLEQAAIRPDHFTDKALELAKAFGASASEVPLTVRNGEVGSDVTLQLVENAEKVLGVPLQSIGTIEGWLDALNVHASNREFSIWPAGEKAVKCSFGRRLDLDDDILPAVRRRVAATGRIKTRPNGDRVSVEVDEIRVIGDSPVDPDAVKGILRDFEVPG